MFSNKLFKFLTINGGLLLIFVIGLVLFNQANDKPPKPQLNKSIENNYSSPGYLPMWSLEDVQKLVDQDKNIVIDGLTKTHTSVYIPYVAIYILYHKAFDQAGIQGTYANDSQQLNASLPDIYKYYGIRPFNDENHPNPRLLLKDLSKQCYIELTPIQQREMIQKLLDIDVFSMDNPIDYERFYRKRYETDVLYDKQLVESDWKALIVHDTVYISNTPKNKTTIDAYIKWLEDNYLPELLKNPVDKWPWDW